MSNLIYIFVFVPPPPPRDSAQRYDFTGLTPNDYMDMDLSSIFGLNSRFGAVLGGISASSQWLRSRLLKISVYQRVLGRCFSNFLEDRGPALPVRGDCRIGCVARLCERSLDDVMKNRWSRSVPAMSTSVEVRTRVRK